MDVKTDSRTDDVRVLTESGAIEVREWLAGCAFTGELEDGETVTFEDGCEATRRGTVVVWWTPAACGIATVGQLQSNGRDV